MLIRVHSHPWPFAQMRVIPARRCLTLTTSERAEKRIGICLTMMGTNDTNAYSRVSGSDESGFSAGITADPSMPSPARGGATDL